jgi:hypothetical protein
MTILIEDAQIERLAEQIAHTEGRSVTEVLREGLLSLAGAHGLVSYKAPLRDKASLRERLARLAQEVDALPSRPPQ